jgi:phosphopantothenoylcysteine decarboxylase
MPSFGSPEGNVAYLIVCAAPPAREVADTVGLLDAAGWRVCVVATPAALAWIDAAALAATTGCPVRSDFRGPDDPEFAPRGDAALVAPASFNTVNKWAAGINDTLALGLVNEALGLPTVPVALVPWVNSTLSRHPAYEASLDRLMRAGAHIEHPATHEPGAFHAAVGHAIERLRAP